MQISYRYLQVYSELRSFLLLYSTCTAQLTSRLIEMRRARPPLALDLRDQHRLRLPVVGSVVLNCRGLANLLPLRQP